MILVIRILMKNILLISFLILIGCPDILAQYEYEPSASNPFGLPNPEAPVEIQDYEQMIGICDCISIRKGSDGAWGDSVNMSWEFRYILNGKAVQDLTLKSDGLHSGSIRQYNADSSSWYVHYYSSASASARLGTWEGGNRGDDIILYKHQNAPNGAEGKYRITFSDITEDGFNWIGEWVTPDESVVFPTWKIFCTKRE